MSGGVYGGGKIVVVCVCAFAQRRLKRGTDGVLLYITNLTQQRMQL